MGGSAMADLRLPYEKTGWQAQVLLVLKSGNIIHQRREIPSLRLFVEWTLRKPVAWTGSIPQTKKNTPSAKYLLTHDLWPV